MYSQYGGVVLDEEEGDHIVKALGNKKVRPHTLSRANSTVLIHLQAVILQVRVTHSIRQYPVLHAHN